MPWFTADRAVEHDAFARVLHRAPQRAILADGDGLGRHQQPFGIQAVQDVAEALAFLADAVALGDEQAVDEDGVAVHRLAAHLRDAPHLDLAAVEVGVKMVMPCRRSGARSLQFRRARQAA